MKMELIKDKRFGDERPLFGIHDARLEDITITEGESGIKKCRNIEADHCRFIGKYPWWHVDHSVITNCYFETGPCSAIWYLNDMMMSDTIIDTPKLFREMNGLKLINVQINDADETFWKVDHLILCNVKLHNGTYPFMFCSHVDVDELKSDSKYVFQYVKDAMIHNAKITTKDSFWETENVTVYDSELNGEFLGWHSENLKLVNCHITGEQPLRYCQDLVLENCMFRADCDHMFEETTLMADIRGAVTNTKNPISGRIVADAIDSVTIDGHALQPSNCEIIVRNKPSNNK